MTNSQHETDREIEPPAPPELDYFGRLIVEVAEPVEVGQTFAGQRRVIPITGGTLQGPEVSGTILNAGADFQLIRSATLYDVDARYVIELDHAARLYVMNPA